MTPIEKKYQEAGSADGFLGAGITNEISTFNGIGTYREFQHGIIYYTAMYGACILRDHIVEKWKSDSVAKSVVLDETTTVRDFIGFPITDTDFGPNDCQFCYFEQGMIISSGSPASSFVVMGSIYQVYRKNNDLSGRMGFPTSDELFAANGGRLSHFTNTDIFWHKNLGAFEVHGGILEKYNQFDGCAGLLGYPLSDENDVVFEDKKIGRLNSFESGTIYWSSDTGAFEIHGSILAAYTNGFKGPSGELGFPTSDELKSINGRYAYNNFQHGILVCDLISGMVQKITSLKVFVVKLETDEDDDDLFVESNTTISLHGKPVISIDKKFGEYKDQGTKTFPEPDEGLIGVIPIADGRYVISVHMKAWDIDGGTNGSDDFIAEFTKAFDINTVWDASMEDMEGNTLLTFYKGPDGLFKAELLFEKDVEINLDDKESFRKNVFWDVHNPSVPELDFNTCAATYSDVESDDSIDFHPLTHAFYDWVYKGAAATGTCFGMCLEAVYALKHRSPSSQPISQYKVFDPQKRRVVFDEQRMEDVCVKFGYQLGGSQILFMLNMMRQGLLWNPTKTFELSRELFASGNFPILCLSKGSALKGGHVVLPYDWNTDNESEWIIRVANPNATIDEEIANKKVMPKFDNTVIRINPKDNTFSYQHQQNETWTGGNLEEKGGRLFAFPYTELSGIPCSPVEDIFSIIGSLTLTIFFGDAEITQVTDASGNQFYDANGQEKTSGKIDQFMSVASLGSPDGLSFSNLDLNINLPIDLPNIILRPKDTSKIFALKNSRVKEQVFVEELGPTIKATKFQNHLRPHVATAVQSGVFAKDLTQDNFVPLLNLDAVFNSGATANTATHQATSGVLDSAFNPATQALEQLADKTLTFDIAGVGSGSYTHAIIAGASKILITANAISGTTDQVIIESIGNAGQAVTFKAHENEVVKNISILVMSFDSSHMYKLTNLTIAPSQAITLQLNNACRELILHNTGQPLQLNLELYLDKKKLPVLSKTGIEIAANQVVHLEPVDWVDISANNPAAAIRMDTFNHIGGDVLNSILL